MPRIPIIGTPPETLRSNLKVLGYHVITCYQRRISQIKFRGHVDICNRFVATPFQNFGFDLAFCTEMWLNGFIQNGSASSCIDLKPDVLPGLQSKLQI